MLPNGRVIARLASSILTATVEIQSFKGEDYYVLKYGNCGDAL